MILLVFVLSHQVVDVNFEFMDSGFVVFNLVSGGWEYVFWWFLIAVYSSLYDI